MRGSNAGLAPSIRWQIVFAHSTGLSYISYIVGKALRLKGDFDGARKYYEKRMEIAKRLDDELAVAMCKKEISLLAASEGNLIEAKSGLESVVPIMRKLDKMAFAGILANLSEINRKLGHCDVAFDIGSEALSLAKTMKKRKSIALISLTLAYTEYERRHYQSARAFTQQALDFFERTGLYAETIEEVKTLIKELQENWRTDQSL